MTTLIKNSAFARTRCWICPLNASVHRVQNNPAVTQLHVLTNGDVLPHQTQRKPTNRGWGIPRTHGLSFMEETWPELRTWRCHWEDAAVSRLAVVKLQLSLPADLPQTKTQLWLLLHQSSLSTEDVSVASARCEHLRCAQGHLDDAKRPPRFHPQGKKKPNRRHTILLPLSSTDVNVHLCKLCRRYPGLTTACDLSCTSSSKGAASGAFGMDSTVLGEGSQEPGEGSLCTHCT